MSNNVIVSVIGGERKIVDGVSTVGDIVDMLKLVGYTPAINGVTCCLDQSVEEGMVVSFSKAVKGGRI